MTKREKKVVVVGGGLGGLSAAASLAADGFAVELYEKNERLGGKLNFKEVDGFSFDLGPSIIILPHLFRRVFERAGKEMDDYVTFEEVQPQWRSFFEDGTTIDLHSDVRLMEQELEKLGPDAGGYFRFVEYSRRLWKFAEEAYLERGADRAMEIYDGHGPLEALEGTDIFSRMDQGVSRYVKHRHLADMLCFFIKYVGSSPYQAPALMNSLAYSQLGWGLWYVSGGMYNLARGLERLLGDLGVTVRCGSEVTRIRAAGDVVDGVEVEGLGMVEADAVVSNMEVLPAYRNLLGVGRDTLAPMEKKLEPACSGLVVHLGVEGDYPQLRHHNFFFSADPKKFLDQVHRQKVLPDDPTIYLVCPTKSDPGLAPKGCSIIKALPHIPYIQDEPYSRLDYEALEERVLDKLERMGLTGLREATVVKDVLTPDDLQRMYYSNRGAIYGVTSHRTKNLSIKAPKRSELFENLYFVGGSVNPGGGTPMVTLCGQKVADCVARDLA